MDFEGRSPLPARLPSSMVITSCVFSLLLPPPCDTSLPPYIWSPRSSSTGEALAACASFIPQLNVLPPAVSSLHLTEQTLDFLCSIVT